MSERGPWSEYRICRECADIGATVKGNDGWYRHKSCARDVDSWPHLEARESLLGVNVSAYRGGKVSVSRNLVHTASTPDIRDLADRFGTRGEEYDRLVPSYGFPCEERESA